MHIVNDITLLATFLRGAAVIREREHGTLEHLLAMPLRPSEIMLAKAWANGLVIVAAAMLSLLFVVIWLLRVPIAGSAVLFAGGVVIYLFSVTSLGILIATLVGWFDAAVRTSGAPNLHHHEFSVRWYDADAANGLACFIFRFLRRPHVHVVARIFGHV